MSHLRLNRAKKWSCPTGLSQQKEKSHHLEIQISSMTDGPRGLILTTAEVHKMVQSSFFGYSQGVRTDERSSVCRKSKTDILISHGIPMARKNNPS